MGCLVNSSSSLNQNSLGTLTWFRLDARTVGTKYRRRQLDGTYLDMTEFVGSDAFFTVKKSIKDTDSEEIINKLSDTALAPGDSTTLIGLFPLTSSDTDLETGTYYYGVHYILNGARTTVGYGKLIIKQPVDSEL